MYHLYANIHTHIQLCRLFKYYGRESIDFNFERKLLGLINLGGQKLHLIQTKDHDASSHSSLGVLKLNAFSNSQKKIVLCPGLNPKPHTC